MKCEKCKEKVTSYFTCPKGKVKGFPPEWEDKTLCPNCYYELDDEGLEAEKNKRK